LPTGKSAAHGVVLLHSGALILPELPPSLAEFAQRYPSSIPVAELAIVNQVESPTTRIAAGTLLKQVAGGKTTG